MVKSVQPVTERPVPDAGVLCMTLAHNEAERIHDFLRHYRAMGVSHFLVVDDGSTDGSLEIFQSQADVTLFRPRGTHYKDHKSVWREDVLDRYAPGRWVLVPDLDELFVYPHCDTRSIVSLCAHLDREGAEAVFAPMVEMYADAPLDQQVYEAGQSMLAAFPYFDGDGYRLMRPSARHLKRYPVPALNMHGGARERLFYGFDTGGLGSLSAWALKRFAHPPRSMTSGPTELAGNIFARFLLRRSARQRPMVMSKIALLKWAHGLQFSGGPHSISARLPLSEVWGAFLHFKFMHLPHRAAYSVARGQHAKDAVHYRRVLAVGGFHRVPRYARSRKYASWRDLLDCGLLRTSQMWEGEPA